MSEIITYEIIYETLRKEKYNNELQNIKEDFLTNVANYLTEKQSILESQEKDLFPKELEKIQKQIQNVKRMLNELYERRENKIMQLAVFSSRMNEPITAPMLLEEKKLYQELVDTLNKHRKEALINLTKPKGIKIVQEPTRLIRFLHAVPQFVGEDLNTYGPFEEEDMASLPLKTADVLIKNNRANEIG